MFRFGNNSRSKLDQCHQDLIKIHETAISLSRIDYGISEGSRTIDRARELFNQGKSTLDPDEGELSKHVITADYPLAMATDIYIYHPVLIIRRRLAYDVSSLCYIAGGIMSIADALLKEGEISHKVRWGGNWDMDGEIISDQDFDDLCHFELIEV